MNKRRRFKARRRRAEAKAMRRRFLNFMRDVIGEYGPKLPRRMHADVLGRRRQA